MTSPGGSECDAAEPDRNGDCCAVFSGKVHPLGAILADGVATPPVTFDYKDRTESPAERNTHSHHAFRLTGSTNGDGAAAPGAQPLGMSLPDSVGAQLGFAEHSPLPTVSNWCRLSPTSVDTAYATRLCGVWCKGVFAASDVSPSYQAAEFSCERHFLSALPPCCFRKYLATGLTNLKGVVGDPWDDGGESHGKILQSLSPRSCSWFWPSL
jgi:hypothetical protein